MWEKRGWQCIHTTLDHVYTSGFSPGMFNEIVLRYILIVRIELGGGGCFTGFPTGFVEPLAL